MLAANGRLLEGAYPLPYQILLCLYDERGKVTIDFVARWLQCGLDHAQKSMVELVRWGLVDEYEGIADTSWHGYEITRPGRLVATAYATGYTATMHFVQRRSPKRLGRDLLLEGWSFVGTTYGRPDSEPVAE